MLLCYCGRSANQYWWYDPVMNNTLKDTYSIPSSVLICRNQSPKKVNMTLARLLSRSFLPKAWHTFQKPLFRNKRFMLDEMFQQNTTKFAIFLEYKNPCFFCSFIFFPNECSGLCWHRPGPGHSLGKKYNKAKWKTKKNYIGFHIP